jgi:choline dehydrogenase-like flavoprotein
MSNQNHYDVVIIGSGAGGGTLAHKLAPTGKKILILERGGYVPREKDNWSPRAVNLEGKYQTKEKWHDKDGKELHPHTNYTARRSKAARPRDASCHRRLRSFPKRA